MMRLNNLDLFSGIGIWSFALKEVLNTTYYCEIDLNCQQVLRGHMKSNQIPTAPIINDITKLSERQICSISLSSPAAITASFPCQDISLANPAGRGLAGARSGLFYQILRVLDNLPTVQMVLLENTPVIVKRGLSLIIEEFTIRGFDFVWGIFSAADMGAPQIRRRFFAIAYRHGFRPPSISNKNLRFCWAQEPVPRVIPRSSASDNLTALRRNRMAGNSIVPQTAVWAYICLRDAVIGINHKKATRPNTPLYTITLYSAGGIDKFQKPDSYKRMSPTKVIMKQGRQTFTKSFWMSPPASNLWYQYRTITDRSTFLLSNQIFWDVNTKKYIRDYGDPNHSLNRMDDRWMINPQWIEWLMGFPNNWTKVANSKAGRHLDFKCDDHITQGKIDML